MSSGLESYLAESDEGEAGAGQARSLQRLAAYVLKERGPFLAGLLLILLGTAGALLEPRLFGYAIDEAIIPRDWPFLRILAGAYLGVVCLRVASVIGQNYLFELLGQRVTQRLRCDLFAHLQSLPISVYDRNPAGRLLTRVTNDIASLNEMFSAGFVSMIGNILLVLGILIGLLILDFKLGLIAMSVFPLMIVASVHFSRRLRVSYRDARSKLSALNAFLAENLLGMKVVHLFNRQKLHLERFARVNQWYTDALVRTIRTYAYFQPTITWCAGVSTALVIWFGGKANLAGGLKVGVLTTYFAYVISLFQPLREIADKWNVFLSGMASAERVFSILNWAPEHAESVASRASRARFNGHVVFDHVWFAYEGEHWVLKDFSLEIPAGSRVAIVGHTGSGKTTLISLLTRFYEIQRGRILIDGRDIREYDKRTLRAAFGIVQQDVFLFSGSFRENVTFWGDSAPAAVGETLENLGLQSWWSGERNQVLEERGTNLSMGQRQVLSFARVLATEPDIWVLDEATANMDSGSEVVLQRALDTAARGKTTLMIAHRLATVRLADEIIVLHKGTILERGRHEALLETDGLYARLYRYQRSADLNSIGSNPPD